jgi:hypothetical protein
VFDEEADTVSVDVGSDTMQVVLCSASDTIPVDMIDFDDTAVSIIHRKARPRTDSDWPPAPKPPGQRRFRKVGVYKAITNVSALIKIR